jgi:hypothetical protein
MPARRLVLLGLAVSVTACAGKKYNPWLITPERFAADINRVAMYPVTAPDDFEDPDPPRLLFDSLVGSALREAGFAVIAADSVSALWQRLVDSSGGLYDPLSGQRNDAVWNALRTRWWSDMRSRYGADAVVFPSIIAVQASFSENKPKWDGTSQGIESFGGSLVRGLFGISREGTTPALSLRIQIEREGTVLYRNQGGIEVIAKPAGGPGSGWTPIPRAELFRDPERNVKAVRIALAPIVEQRRVASSAP